MPLGRPPIVILACCCHNPSPSKIDTPTGVDAPCAVDVDCDGGLVCVIEDEARPEIEHTCQSPCSNDVGGPSCVDYGVDCWFCDELAVPSVCRPTGCS